MAKDWRIEAARIWPELAAAASARGTTTYGDLGARVGVAHRNLRLPLDIIARHVQRIGLPPLTVVVVSGDTKRPGDGIVGSTAERLEEDLARVYDRDWGAEKNPFAFFAP